MAAIDTIANRSSGTAIAGKAYFETSTNKFIVYNGSAWIELDSDGTGASHLNRWGAYLNTSWSSSGAVSSHDQINTGYMPTASATDFSMSWWFKGTTSNVNRSLSPTRGTKYAGAFSPYLISAETSTRSLLVAYPGANTGWSWTAANTIDDIVDGDWHHLVLVVADNPNGSGSLIELYLDGSLYHSSVEGQFTGHTYTSTASSTFKIGTLDGGAYWFGDYIDDVAFFESKITSSQVTTLYNSGKPADISSLSPDCWLRMGDDSNDNPTDGGALTSVTDSSGNGNTVTTTASTQPTFKALDQSTTSLSFDGSNDYLDCGGSADFSFTDGAGNDSAFSISAWVKLDANNRSRVVGKGNAEWLFGTNANNKLSLYLWSNDTTSAYIAQEENTALATGTWHHIVATYDGSNNASGIKIYRAGSLVTMSNASSGSYAGMALQQGALRIGQWEVNASVMDGLVDEVAVFNSALSASEVSSLAASRGAHIVNDLSLSPTAYYRMGEDDNLTAGASASQITDASGNGNHATQSTAANQPTASISSTIYV
jgi:hypothetical protein